MVNGEEINGTDAESGSGDRRQVDRREVDRRRGDRRAGLSRWRGPLAYAGYGAVATILAVAGLHGLDSPAPEGPALAAAMEIEPMADIAPAAARPAPPSPTIPRQAFTLADFEVLLAEGESAVGQTVQAELYCQSIAPVAIRATLNGPGAALIDIVDAEGRVGGAECRWSNESRTSDFLLVIPPDLAEAFTAMPEVELNFVQRRRVRASVEWLGRSDPLSLRIAGVLRAIEES
jgi:hypothetical protein